MKETKKILDLEVGEQAYIQAMRLMLHRIQTNELYSQSQKSPEELANLMITSTFTYIQGLLPDMSITEATSLFASVIGLAVAGYMHEGKLSPGQVNEITACFAVALDESIPRALQGFKALEQQQKKHG